MKYLILGAGPAGLTFANQLKQRKEIDFLVLEKEKEAGGLCRSAMVDGYPMDIGGGHFLDVKYPEITTFLFEFMPESEWNMYERNSHIMINGCDIHHPIEANIWQMSIEMQVAFLKSIAAAGCNTGSEMPERFVEWIYWKLGSRIAEDYMLPYNRKVFGKDLEQLGTYWLEKLPNVSFEETLLSCLTKKAYGKQPGHAVFYYPKQYGFGEVWKRMAGAVEKNIRYEQVVSKIDFDTKTVTTTSGEKYSADTIITTIPWLEFQELIGMPQDMRNLITELKVSSIQTEYFNQNLDTDAHWIYYPNPELSYHRILVRHNFCPGSNGYWTETNGERVEKKETGQFRYWNQYAYPLNTITKPSVMERLLSWSRKKGVIALGRWGEHQHYNVDVTVRRAIMLANEV